MLSRFWAALTNIDQEESNRIKRGLYIVLATGLLAAILVTIISIVSGYQNVYGVTFFAVIVLASLLAMTASNQLVIPRLAAPTLGLLIAIYITQSADGIRDEAMFLYPLTIVLAGILIGKGGIIVYTLASLAAIVNQGLNEINGVLVNNFSSGTSLQTIVMLSVLISFTGLLLYITIDSLRGSLLKAHLSEKKFADNNRELEAIRTSLEERVKARTAQLQVGAEVGQAASATLNPAELLRTVTNLITDRFGFYYASVFITEPSGRYAILREATGEAGRLLKERQHRLEIGGQSMVSAAITTQKPRIAQDVSTEELRFANPLLPETRAEIALPLVVGNRVLGALNVQSTEVGVFDESSAAALQAMTDQIALALNNATSFVEAQTAARQARALYTASQKVGQLEADLQTVLNSMLQIIGQSNEFNQWLVAVFDERREQLRPIAYQATGDQPPTIQLSEHADLLLVRSAGRSEVFLSNAPFIAPSPLAKPGTFDKQISAPLIVRGLSTGALLLGRTASDPDWIDRDRELIESIAGLIVIAIENRELAQKTEQAAAELTAINRRLTGESWSTVTRQKAGGVLWISLDDRSERSSLPEVREALTSGQITTRSIAGSQQLGVAIPIKLRDVSIGVLRLAMPQTAWNTEVSLTLESIAGHAAQAAENARLLSVTEERFARERVLSESTDKIRRTAEVEQILQTAAEELARHLQANRVSVRIHSAAETPGDRS
jgi:GAF domain-containing protein